MITIGQDKILVMAHFLRCDLKVKFSGVRLRGAGTARAIDTVTINLHLRYQWVGNARIDAHRKQVALLGNA
jgi:hypothetical protein